MGVGRHSSHGSPCRLVVLSLVTGLLAIGLSTVGAGPTAGQALALTSLQPHRAAYRLNLAGAHQMSGLSDVTGGLVIEWRLTCDGWLSHQRMGFIASTETGDFSHDVRFNSWESMDGSKMRYTVRSYDGDTVREEYQGEARITSPEEGGVASFTLPEKRDVILPPGTIFPTEHMKRLLLEADGGQPLVSYDVFDGWGFDALTQVTSAIGRQRPVEPSDGNQLAVTASKAWPISMAYYNLAEEGDLPEFEVAFLMTEHGVLQELLLDYGDFSLKATLTRFDALTRPAC